MNTFASDVRLEHEDGKMVRVVCSRCEKEIGRLTTEPSDPMADQEEIRAEIRLVADEHHRLFHAEPSVTSPEYLD